MQVLFTDIRGSVINFTAIIKLLCFHSPGGGISSSGLYPASSSDSSVAYVAGQLAANSLCMLWSLSWIYYIRLILLKLNRMLSF